MSREELAAVRALKRRWYNLIAAEMCGFGIAPTYDGWALKVNVRWNPQGDVPTEIDGIPVIVECVGLVVPAVVACTDNQPQENGDG